VEKIEVRGENDIVTLVVDGEEALEEVGKTDTGLRERKRSNVRSVRFSLLELSEGAVHSRQA
jgi:hypothetical protein